MHDMKIINLDAIDENIPFGVHYYYDSSYWDRSYPAQHDLMQQGMIRLRLFIQQVQSRSNLAQHNGYFVRFFDPTNLANNTVISAGQAIANDLNKGRGYYLEHCEVGVEVLNNHIMWQVNPPPIVFGGSLPQDKNQGGSTSSSSGFNASAGMFGEAPTLGIGYNSSTSGSHEYSDMSFYNKSQMQMLHQYRMTGTVGEHASKYTDPQSLIWSSFPHHAALRTPPPQMYNPGHLPIVSQGFWQVPLNFDGYIAIKVGINMRFRMMLLHDRDSIGDYDGAPFDMPAMMRRQYLIYNPQQASSVDKARMVDLRYVNWIFRPQVQCAALIAMGFALARTPCMGHLYNAQGQVEGTQAVPKHASPQSYMDLYPCIAFVQQFPELRHKFADLSHVSHAWSYWVHHWDAATYAVRHSHQHTIAQMLHAANGGH